MRVRLLIIGDEILSGRTRDSNGGWLAERLDALGHDVRRIVVCPDEDDVIVHELRAALDDAPAVIVSGGLGPTHDDRTTAAVARLLGRPLVVHEEGWRRLQERYAKRFGGATPPREMIESARKMVTIPEGAQALPNPVGASTGYVARHGEGSIIVLPGVPRELTAMFDAHVAGKALPSLVARTVVELDVALAEAGFARLLEDVSREFPDVAIGSYPKSDELRVTLRFKGSAGRALAARDAVRERVGEEHVLDAR